MSLTEKEDWQKLLQTNYHHLCRSVRPEAFFSWLRSRGVFSCDDQEEVEHKYVTTVMKSGHLIDKVLMKGERGFMAFMEVVEYIYPDTYYNLTGKQPRKPPRDFEPPAGSGRRRDQALSTEILGQMGDLVNVLSQANAYKKDELDKLQTYVKQLQGENQSQMLELKDNQEEIEQLKQKLNVMVSKNDHDSKDRKLLQSEFERLRELKDKYMEESQKLRQDRDDCKMIQLKKEHELHRSKTCRVPAATQLEKLKEMELEIDKLDVKSEEWQSKCTSLQERYNHVLVNLEEVKLERNQASRQLEDLQNMYDKEREENKRLVTDCDKYHDKFCNMESQMTSLKQEIEQLQQMQNEKFNDSSLPHNDVRKTLSNTEVSNDEKLSSADIARSNSLEANKPEAARPLQTIPHTPGLCPTLQRQVVVTHKTQKQTSFASA